jgi:outer membrane lipoprotein-sorting protein
MPKLSLPVVAASLLLLGAGCSFNLSGKSAVDAQPAQEQAAAPSTQAQAGADIAAMAGLCPYDDKTLCKFLMNWNVSANMSMRTMSTIDGKKTESTFETDGKESSRMTYRENGKDAYATVTIGNAMYTKEAGSAVWMKLVLPEPPKDGHPPGDAEGTPKLDFTAEDDADAATQSYKPLGKEACGKLTCFKYEMTMSDSTEKQHLWFDDKEYRLRRLVDFAKDGMTTDTEFSYDAVVITEPSPVQEQKMDFGAIMGLSPEEQKAMEEQLKAMQGQFPTE